MRNNAMIILLTCGLFFCSSKLEAWDQVRTHRDLSEISARQSVATQNYLLNLGYSKSLNEVFNGKEVFEWIRDGAYFEDAGNVLLMAFNIGRSFNHFHNPLKPWESAGLDDWITLPPFHATGQSSLLWAQDGSNQQTAPEGDWSWQKVREYFYIAARQQNL